MATAKRPASGMYDYDLAVIGGGSGGMAAAKEAASHGAKVVLFDYVKPSTQGTKWGLGGTCVNVGCVPKKLMHYAGITGETIHDSKAFGWSMDNVAFDWDTCKTNVVSHVKKLNFLYKNGLRSGNVEYINGLAKFTDAHTLAYMKRFKEKDGFAGSLTAANVLIAVGGRPTVPDVPGAKEHAITSDDIFYLKKTPGKTLCVGAGYISLECGGFLHAMGFDVTVAVRSILLRGFDRDCANKIGEVMHASGIKFLNAKQPKSIVKQDDGRLLVTLADSKTGEETTDVFDTVLYAAGRYADTKGLDLDKAGVNVLPNGKLETTNEATNIPHIFGVGDILEGKPELTPVAIQAGERLAARLFNGSSKQMDYINVPTAVFTPTEYGACGYGEEDAIKKFGAENIETFLWQWTTLEYQAAHRERIAELITDPLDKDMPANCLGKLVTLKSEGGRVVGFHFIGPNAGEVTQGFAVALRAGATKEMFDDVVGIHPTDAEAFNTMTVTRKDITTAADWTAAAGCGGGKCG